MQGGYPPPGMMPGVFPMTGMPMGMAPFAMPMMAPTAIPPARTYSTGAPPPTLLSRVRESSLTTVYVGRIPPNVDDDFMRQLLTECGRVMSWKRTKDPTTQKLAVFGFCEFESPQGVLRAVKLLNDQTLGEKQLQVKTEQKVTDYVENWRVNHLRELKAKKQQEKEGKEGEGGEGKGEGEEGTVGEAGMSAADAEKAVEEELAAEEARVKEAITQMIADKNKEFENEAAAEAAEKERRSKTREREITRPPGRPKQEAWKGVTTHYVVNPREKARENARKERQITLDKDYARKEREWDREEERRHREKKRAAEEESNREKHERDKRRLIEKDLDDDEQWSKRKRQEKRHKRALEREADDIDRNEEAEEIEIQRIAAAEAAEQARRQREKELEDEREMLAQIEREKEAQRHREMERRRIQEVEALAERQRAEEEERRRAEEEKVRMALAGGEWGGAAESMRRPQPSPPKLDVFGDDHDECGIFSRKHKPLTKLEEHYDRTNIQIAEEVRKKRLEIVQQIVQQIPSERDELFNYPIEWPVIEHAAVVEASLKPWIKKKVIELLGGEEEEVCAFVVSELNKRCSPLDLLATVGVFLDQEAEGFIVKLWRMLIFEQLKRQHPTLSKDGP